MDYVIMDGKYYLKMVKKHKNLKVICGLSVTFLILNLIFDEALIAENRKLRAKDDEK